MSIRPYLSAVLWSFFGIRRRQAAEADMSRLSFIPLGLTAVGLAALFVLILLGIAHGVAGLASA